MVSVCANPECREEFLYFGQGQLMAVPRRVKLLTESKVEFFWLCSNCAGQLNLEVALDGATNLVSRQTAPDLRTAFASQPRSCLKAS